jgi:hypothetical protein
MIYFLLTAVIFGWLEAFEMEHQFHTGPPDFLGKFVLKYHGPMFVFVLLVGLSNECPHLVAWWALVEDLSFWAFDKWFLGYNFKLTKDSWIVNMMGGIASGRILIPIVYLVLFAAGLIPYLLIR